MAIENDVGVRKCGENKGNWENEMKIDADNMSEKYKQKTFASLDELSFSPYYNEIYSQFKISV